MNKITTAMVLAGFVALSACADDAVKEDQVGEEVLKEQLDEESATAVQDAEEVSKEAIVDEASEAALVEEEPQAEPMDSSASATADKLVSTCTYDGAERIISVVYDNEATGTVCEVTYEKASGVQTLWSAYNERDYCLDKAKAFVEKQREWGWTCSDL